MLNFIRCCDIINWKISAAFEKAFRDNLLEDSEIPFLLRKLLTLCIDFDVFCAQFLYKPLPKSISISFLIFNQSIFDPLWAENYTNSYLDQIFDHNILNFQPVTEPTNSIFYSNSLSSFPCSSPFTLHLIGILDFLCICITSLPPSYVKFSREILDEIFVRLIGHFKGIRTSSSLRNQYSFFHHLDVLNVLLQETHIISEIQNYSSLLNSIIESSRQIQNSITKSIQNSSYELIVTYLLSSEPFTVIEKHNVCVEVSYQIISLYQFLNNSVIPLIIKFLKKLHVYVILSEFYPVMSPHKRT
ncbi:hypothetical protein RCL1_003448 [Eukaryota sp. TZLM3-RCL]